jgi:hypothetical protein
MKKIIITLFLITVAAVSSFAADINETWNKLSHKSEFYTIALPEEQAQKNGFDNLSVAKSDKVTNVKELENIVRSITGAEQLADVNAGGGRVIMYAHATGHSDKFDVLIYIQNGSNVAILNGVCGSATMRSNMGSLDLGNVLQ